ncbi:MAG: cystathionine gamma-synthase family protein [Hymenobacteraceae bacterium]|nr:cystathionine gamma-synthase family protein [Hymenobacteraceae bacterium]
MKNAHKKTTINGQPMQPESLMMSYGYAPAWSENAIKPPIFQTSTFVFRTAEEGKAFFELAYGLRQADPAEEMGLIYSRLNNPSLEILEDRLTLWEGAEAAASFASGMAAVTTTLLALLSPGDVVLHSEPVYGGTDFFLKNILPRFGITSIGFLPTASPEEIAAKAATAPGRLAMIFVETPANPTNHLIDLEACVALAAAHSSADKTVRVVVDNTFLGPIFQQPLRHGADLCVYSATKFLGGHSDLIAGAVVGSKELLKEVKAMRTFMGTMCDPNTGWMLMRSLETLKLRMERASQSAAVVADWLREHPLVTRTYYLGHLAENSAQADIYRRHCLAPGSMISFDIRGGEAEAFRFLNALKLVKLAVSLGGTESLAEHPATMTHSDIAPPMQREMGITEQMIRLSIGVEDPRDLIADLQQAFAAVRAEQPAAMLQPA